MFVDSSGPCEVDSIVANGLSVTLGDVSAAPCNMPREQPSTDAPLRVLVPDEWQDSSAGDRIAVSTSACVGDGEDDNCTSAEFGEVIDGDEVVGLDLQDSMRLLLSWVPASEIIVITSTATGPTPRGVAAVVYLDSALTAYTASLWQATIQVERS